MIIIVERNTKNIFKQGYYFTPMLIFFLFLNLSFKDFSLTVLVPVIDDKNKMKLNIVENRKKIHEKVPDLLDFH